MNTGNFLLYLVLVISIISVCFNYLALTGNYWLIANDVDSKKPEGLFFLFLKIIILKTINIKKI
jgi:hypothetical protein